MLMWENVRDMVGSEENKLQNRVNTGLRFYKDRRVPGGLYTQIVTVVISEVVGIAAGFGFCLLF